MAANSKIRLSHRKNEMKNSLVLAALVASVALAACGKRKKPRLRPRLPSKLRPRLPLPCPHRPKHLLPTLRLLPQPLLPKPPLPPATPPRPLQTLLPQPLQVALPPPSKLPHRLPPPGHQPAAKGLARKPRTARSGLFACPRPSNGAGQAGPAAVQGGVAFSRRSSRCRCAGPPPRSGPAPSRWPRRARHGRGPGGCSGR